MTRRIESLSPSVRLPQSESTSSIKIIARPPSDSRASSNRFRTSFSDSPCHLEIRSALLIEKNVESASVATAFARNDFPATIKNKIELQTRKCGGNNDTNQSKRSKFHLPIVPVPGGPKSNIPLNGRRFPVNSCGKRVGKITVCKAVTNTITAHG